MPRAKSTDVKVVESPATAYPNLPWVVHYPAPDGGSRKRKRFPSKRQADAFAKKREKQIFALGQDALAISEDRNALNEIAWCKKQIEPFGMTIREVISDWLLSQRQIERSRDFSEVAKEFSSSKKGQGLKQKSLNDYQTKLDKFAETYGATRLSTLTASQIESFLHSLKVSKATRNGYFRVLHACFNFAVKRGYIEKNPMIGVFKAKEDHPDPTVITPDELQLVLNEATRAIQPLYIIGAFCGCRVAEIRRLHWSAFDWDSKELTVPANVSKTGKPRYIPVPDCAMEWLKPYRKASGKILKTPHSDRTFRERLKMKKDFKLPQNSMRVSFVSYAVAKTENQPQVALWAGHSLLIEDKHYRRGVKKDAAEQWFSVFPKE